MPAVIRLLLLIVVLGGVGWFVLAVTRGEVPDVPDPVAAGSPGTAGQGNAGSVSPRELTSSAQCAECHPQIYAEWEASYHGQAWTDPEYQLLRTAENSQDCIPCHAPKPAYQTGVGNRFLARYDRRVEGVDCFTCHQTPEGMIGPIPDPQPAPCRPLFDPNIRKIELCYPCHNQHDTHKEWEASEWFQKGMDCNTCHMPEVERPAAEGGPVRTGSRHDFLGGHHPEYTRTAVTFETRLLEPGENAGPVFQGPFGVDEPDPALLALENPGPTTEEEGGPAGRARVLLRVTNTGAGHNFPTDSRNNTVDLKLLVFNAEGVEVSRIFVDRFRNPYRDEYKQNKTNTQIPSGAVRTYVVQLPLDHGTYESRLLYKSGPFDEDEKDTTVVLFREKGDF